MLNRYTKCSNTECCNAKQRYVEFVMLSDFVLSVIMLSDCLQSVVRLS
jgi:hypothetical protein